MTMKNAGFKIFKWIAALGCNSVARTFPPNIYGEKSLPPPPRFHSDCVGGGGRLEIVYLL